MQETIWFALSNKTTTMVSYVTDDWCQQNISTLSVSHASITEGTCMKYAQQAAGDGRDEASQTLTSLISPVPAHSPLLLKLI